MPNYLIEHQLLAQPIHHNCKPNSIISAHCPYTLSPHILYIHKVIIVWQPNNIHNSRCGRDKRQRGGVIVINVVHKLSWRWLYGSTVLYPNSIMPKKTKGVSPYQHSTGVIGDVILIANTNQYDEFSSICCDPLTYAEYAKCASDKSHTHTLRVWYKRIAYALCIPSALCSRHNWWEMHAHSRSALRRGKLKELFGRRRAHIIYE